MRHRFDVVTSDEILGIWQKNLPEDGAAIFAKPL